MKLFDVYPLMSVTPQKALDCYVWDSNGNKYLDMYGGHAVISIGHSHPHYVNRLTQQLNDIGFYSNSVQNPLQDELAVKLGELSNFPDYSLFLCNSGAEANENALKLASFHNGKKRVIAFKKAFHGRTSAAVATTDNPTIQAEINKGHQVTFLELNNIESVTNEIEKGDVCAIIVEGIQGIGGIRVPENDFLKGLESLCNKNNTVLILDEIQSGYGRSGRFFACQESGIRPHIITLAKGMGNGFPIGGMIISPVFKASYGLLGTTFGGNYLACAAALAVVEVIKNQDLISNAKNIGNFLTAELASIPQIEEVRGRGLMLGLQFNEDVGEIRKKLVAQKGIFTGISSNNIIRLLPPLTLTIPMAEKFITGLKEILKT